MSRFIDLARRFAPATAPRWRPWSIGPRFVRGIKEDICDLVLDEPPQAKTSAQLPPFGSSFVRGIATNVIDTRVTPQALVAVTQRPASTPAVRGANVQVNWAFFGGPTQFLVDLRAPEMASPIRLQMDLHGGAWQVTRVWLPAELLGQANSRTATVSGSPGQTDIAERIQ